MPHRLLRWISLLITRLVPPGKVLVFCSFPDFTDNAYAVYRYVIQCDSFASYKLVWIALDARKTDSERIPLELRRPGTYVFPKKSLRALWYYIRARHVFFTHGLYSHLLHFRPRTVVNLWHCMPIKRMGLLDKGGAHYMENTQLLLATSVLFQKIMADTFGKRLDDVWVCGLPRNDLLFTATDFYMKQGIERKAYRQIGVWLPTYRTSIVGDIRTDGSYQEGSIGFLDAAMLGQLDDYLAQQDTLLIVKPHPMDIMQEYNFPVYRNIKVVKQNQLSSQLYPLLGSTDFLLTDYSSVWVDYDILGKPMGFIMDDLAAYGKSRGFTLDNIETDSPGVQIRDMGELFAFIAEPGRYCKPTGDRFNLFKDNGSTKRLLDGLGLGSSYGCSGG